MPDNLFRRGTIWWVRTKVKGKKLRKSLRTASLAEAKKRAKPYLKKAERLRAVDENGHSWMAAVGRWLIENGLADVEEGPDGRAVKPLRLEQQNISEGTARRYAVSLGQVGPLVLDKDGTTLESLTLAEIDKKIISKVVNARKLAGTTNATIRRDLTAMSAIFTAAEAWAWHDENPAAAWPRKSIKERREPIVMPELAHIDAVVAAAPGNFARMIRFAQYSGMREEETASLERPQVSTARRAADLSRTKTNRPRSVALEQRALDTLGGTPAHLKSLYFFWHDDGERYCNVASQFAAITLRVAEQEAAAGRHFRRFRFHDLRHWYAVDYLRRRVGSIYDLQLQLGHASIKTTEIYLRYLTPEEAAAAKTGGTLRGTDVAV